jgi:trafficking protein particle complex subunit 3
MSKPSASWQAVGEASFARCDRVSAELLALTYGSFVRQLLADYEDVEEVNKQLHASGYNMGVRLADDFVSKARIQHCNDFTETAEVIAKVAFKMFLGIPALVGTWSPDKKTFGLVFEENPLAEFAELPDGMRGLWYSNILCGVIRGALEMVNMKVECKFVRDRLKGDEANEIRVTLNEILDDKPIASDD